MGGGAGWRQPARASSLATHCHLDPCPHAAPACRVAEHEPLVLLCIAAATINQAATKRVPDRHRAVLQGFAFLQEYSDARWV